MNDFEELPFKKVNFEELDDEELPFEKVYFEELNCEELTLDEDIEELNIFEASSSKKISPKSNKKIITCFFIVISLIIIIFVIKRIFFYPILNDVYVEVGTKEIKLEYFFRKGKTIKYSSFQTDISRINLDKVSDYSIKIKYRGKVKKVKLHLIDTTKPKVKFTNIVKYIDYKIDPNDFIVEKFDMSKMKVEIEKKPKIEDFGRYYVVILVSDEYGNITKKKCILDIKFINEDIELELGDKLTREKIFYNSRDVDAIVSENEINKINSSSVGEYKIPVFYKNKEYIVNIKIKDTTPPELVLNDITIYYGNKINTKDAFIKSANDLSGDVKTTLKSEINNNLGTHEIIIEAEDKYGNKIEKKCSLYVIKDTIGPVFSGLTDLYINKNSNVDYYNGVSALDAKDGIMNFTVDTSTLNISKYGTYYINYISYDKSGNKTEKKRKVIVNNDYEDTNNKFNEFFNSYLSGKDVYGIVKTIREKIAYNYNWGENDPVWYGLTNYKGNCYVHALLVKKALDKMNIENLLIYATDKYHYWNLVNIGGVWRHYDSTPGGHIIGPATDSEKLSSSSMKGRTWNTDAFPKAE